MPNCIKLIIISGAMIILQFTVAKKDPLILLLVCYS